MGELVARGPGVARARRDLAELVHVQHARKARPLAVAEVARADVARERVRVQEDDALAVFGPVAVHLRLVLAQDLVERGRELGHRRRRGPGHRRRRPRLVVPPLGRGRFASFQFQLEIGLILLKRQLPILIVEQDGLLAFATLSTWLRPTVLCENEFSICFAFGIEGAPVEESFVVGQFQERLEGVLGHELLDRRLLDRRPQVLRFSDGPLRR